MPNLNVVISKKAKEKFEAVQKLTNKNQHDTATQIFENMDLNSFKGKS